MQFGKPSRDAADADADKRAPVLDQGIVITGDVLVKLMGMKLLPVKVRLLVSSTKLAGELGLDWWRDDGEAQRRRRRAKDGKKRSKNKPESSLAPRRRRREEGNGSRDQE